MLARGEKLPDGVDFTGRFIYYVGPVDPVRDEAVGPAGPTTATRMDRYTEAMLAFADLGMEAIYEFEVEDMPVTVAVDTQGRSVHDIGPAEWKQRIGMIPLKQI